MTDPYRTAVNPYTAKAEEACAKLQRERTAATELEAQRVALLAEVNAGLAPFQVYRRQGYTLESNTVRLTHPDSGEACYLCNEDSMLEDPKLLDALGEVGGSGERQEASRSWG